MWRRPHLSVPGKLEALEGKVVQKLGMRSDPNFFKFFEDLGFTGTKYSEHCYLVEFAAKTRTICIEVFQSWLQREAKHIPMVETSNGEAGLVNLYFINLYSLYSFFPFFH